ncbi:unnamed protein product [Rotaria magnacalcarata]|nr:unnamed protein product [Rotaria magnacalcarata]CAF2010405.1 unnamed protein product [Rotaria magnacalcarata]
MYGPEHYCPKFIKVKSDWCSKCLNRHNMKILLDIATSDTHFSFNNLHYQQHNVVAMGSPVAPVLTDIFMIHLENKLMDKLKKPGALWYKRCVDDTFVIILKKANNRTFCIVHRVNRPHSDQIIALTAKLTNFKSYVPIVSLDRDNQFLRY